MITRAKNDYIFGIDKIKDDVLNYCKVIINSDEEFKTIKRKLSITPTFLFYGYPGTGKTTLANEVYETLKKDEEIGNIDKYAIKIDEMLSSNFGESSKNLISKFNEIKLDIATNNSTAFIIIDELDYFTNSRFYNNNDSITRVLLTFNKIVDDLISENIIDKMIIVATTNIRENIDTSILRRFFFHKNFNIILDKKNFNDYVEQLYNIINVQRKYNIDIAYDIYKEKQFTLGEIKYIFSNLYMERKIGIHSNKELEEVLRDITSYHEIISNQKEG